MPVERIRVLGFDTVLALAPDDLALETHRGTSLLRLVETLGDAGLDVWVTLCLGRFRSDHELVDRIAPHAFRPAHRDPAWPVDPRKPRRDLGAGMILRRGDDPLVLAWWLERLDVLTRAGIAGFVAAAPGSAGGVLAMRLRHAGYDVRRFDYAFAASEDHEGVIVPSADRDAAARKACFAEALLHSRGWAMEAGTQIGVEQAVTTVNRFIGQFHAGDWGPRRWTSPGAAIEVTSREISDAEAVVALRNRGPRPMALPADIRMPWGDLHPLPGFDEIGPEIAPGQTRVCLARRLLPVLRSPALPVVQAAASPARIVVAGLAPSVDQGAFPVKTVIGECMTVSASIFADGHEQLAAELLVRAADGAVWTRRPLAAQPNDVWTAAIRFDRLGRHEMAIEAWLDVWGGYVRDLRLKHGAGNDVTLEIREGRALIEQVIARSPAPLPRLADAVTALDRGDGPDVLLSEELRVAMRDAADRPFLTRSFAQPVEVEREAAGFASWYELFPRSQSDAAGRHGTLRDVVRRLPHIAAMGFDTVYFPPIHPIGEKNRKGRNNSLAAAPNDPGSPYAIGSAAGGHDAIHPQLGSLADFRALIAAARAVGIEIALDFAVQCAPDHPWVRSHPGWFAWRPDGTIRYAENPPKKYQDIVNVDFYGADAIPDLWRALRDVVLFWVSEGVAAFRVDNPHTKPFAFWRWLIEEVKARHPEVIFLSEAFTRPKPMYHLAKVGFSQSYTYFIWRETKAALTEYVTDLTQSDIKNYFRPHFFVNTPDINPYFLQSSGRPGFLIRAALAATLSGLFGVYSGFELCEESALPGREEYLDSEKYEIRHRPPRASGDIVAEIAQLNRLRRAYPALQSHLGITFHNAFNDQIVYFAKQAPGETDLILVAVSLDPQTPQEADFEVPLWRFGLADGAAIDAEELLSGRRVHWVGKIQHLRLTPEHPYALWRLIAPRERDGG